MKRYTREVHKSDVARLFYPFAAPSVRVRLFFRRVFRARERALDFFRSAPKGLVLLALARRDETDAIAYLA